MRAIALAWLACTALAAHPGTGGRPNQASTAENEPRTAVFLFGPGGAERAQRAAQGASASCRRWLSQAGSAAELRRAGSTESLPLDRRTPAKAIEQAFREAAAQARESDPDTFLTALDAAAQALARRPGLHLLVAIAENPPLSRSAEQMLQQVESFCQANSIRVIVLDSAQVSGRPATGAFASLGPRTGGALIQEPKALDAQMVIASAGAKRAESAYAAPPPKAEVAASLPGMPTDLPVHTQFFRLSPRTFRTAGKQMSVGAGMGGISTSSSPGLEDTTGPMRGLFLVESPISALQFETDDNAGTYSARARITQIARNAAGKAVWQASKEVTLRGPLRKLADRRSGNLYYLREVVLPAGRYTLEATVEDLAAGKSGGVREPLRTGMGTPGFTVSDALIVRPYRGSADKFEADQVLNYDGNAIAPLLEPEYRAEEPFQLQIYLILYPDLYGAQPELSLEMLRNGRVVSRGALPFTDRIRNDVTEGSLSPIGEQKHEFPYLVTLRNVRFSPGEYEARVTVRQGRNALTRSAHFRVTGGEQAAAPTADGPGAAPAGAAADEAAEVTLPEIDPVHLTAEAAMPAAERERLWQEAATSALSYSARLPNFRCNRETHRLAASVRSPDRFRETDAFVEELTYESGKESYRTLEVNGQTSNLGRAALKGVSSRGEFGSMLKSVFRPEIGAQYKWAGQALTGGVLCDVFDIDVPVDRSNFVLTFNLRQEIAGFQGRVFIDGESNLVRRIVLRGASLPKDFGLQSPVFSLEYGLVRVGENDFLLPLRSVLQVRQGRNIVRNETRFRDYRKFDASSNIKFE